MMLVRVLQQYLPFTVLKPTESKLIPSAFAALQQYLPFTVLKRSLDSFAQAANISVATVLTVYGIETF